MIDISKDPDNIDNQILFIEETIEVAEKITKQTGNNELMYYQTKINEAILKNLRLLKELQSHKN